MTRALETSFAAFGDDGHLTEEALVLLADGQELSLEAADAHLGTCEACTDRLVAFSLASSETGELLRAALAAEATSPVHAPVHAMPWRAVMAALALSSLGLFPSLARAPSLLVQGAPAVAHGAPVLLRGVARAFALQGSNVTLATLASSALLIVVGVVVSRVSRHEGVVS